MPCSSPQEENKALCTKVEVLERELKQRNADFAKLRDEVQQLLQIKQKYESQQDVVIGLQNSLNYARAAHESALETIERMKKEDRDATHRERVERVQFRLNDCEHQTLPTQLKKSTKQVEGNHKNSNVLFSHSRGGVVPTSSGPQLVCQSSDISSLGFAPAKRPIDFLGGPQFQHSRGETEDDEAEVHRIMAMTQEEANMDIQYAEVQDHEEKELRERLEALRRRR